MASQYTHWMVCSTAGTSKHRLCKMFVILLPGTVALYNFSSSVCSDYMMIFCLAFGNDDGKYSNFIGTLDQTGGNVSLSRKVSFVRMKHLPYVIFYVVDTFVFSGNLINIIFCAIGVAIVIKPLLLLTQHSSNGYCSQRSSHDAIMLF